MRGYRVPISVCLLAIGFITFSTACSTAQGNIDPKAIEEKYGLTGAFVETISTEDGPVEATIVPTIYDGRRAQLVIPHKQIDDTHQVFLRDGVTITPIELEDTSIRREEFIKSEPKVVERRSTPTTSTTAAKKSNNRSLKDEALIVGGSAGAGAAIGAVAGGKKGAAIGAVSGGVAGLVYDLATRKK
jgi:hypothetical protein